jgi:hypothetical protein
MGAHPRAAKPRSRTATAPVGRSLCWSGPRLVYADESSSMNA